MATDAGAIQVTGGATTYAPSWVNVVNAWFERLPGPTWLAYVAAMALGIAVSAGATVLDPSTQVPLALAYYGALPFAVLALIHSLDRTAGRALRSLRPLLRMDDAGVAETHERLTVVPARPAMLLFAVQQVLARFV